MAVPYHRTILTGFMANLRNPGFWLVEFENAINHVRIVVWYRIRHSNWSALNAYSDTLCDDGIHRWWISPIRLQSWQSWILIGLNFKMPINPVGNNLWYRIGHSNWSALTAYSDKLCVGCSRGCGRFGCGRFSILL